MYKKQIRDIFNSIIKQLDTSKLKKTADRINKWVSDVTNNKIKNLIKKCNYNSLNSKILNFITLKFIMLRYFFFSLYEKISEKISFLVRIFNEIKRKFFSRMSNL